MTTRKRLHEKAFTDSGEESDAQETWEDAWNGDEPEAKKVRSFMKVLPLCIGAMRENIIALCTSQSNTSANERTVGN